MTASGDHSAPVPPSPIVLDYQRSEQARRFVTRGLLLMGFGLIGIAMVVIAVIAVMSRRRYSAHEISVIAPFILAALVWGAAYVVLSWKIRSGSRGAGKMALVMTLLQAAGWTILAVMGLIKIVGDGYDTWLLEAFVIGLFAVITLGFWAIVVEVWRALRDPRVWAA